MCYRDLCYKHMFAERFVNYRETGLKKKLHCRCMCRLVVVCVCTVRACVCVSVCVCVCVCVKGLCVGVGGLFGA